MGHKLSTELIRGVQRCTRCLMHEPLCICALMPCIETTTRVVLIAHVREIRKPTNTGGLACRALSNSEIVVRGEQGAPIDYEKLVNQDFVNLFLFPNEHSVKIDQWKIQNQEIRRPVRLLVPDGNWGQAARVYRRLPSQASVQVVDLPGGAPSEYLLRREPVRRPEGMATLEAIARALSILEGNDEVSDQLMQIFRIMRDRTLWTKGKVKLDQQMSKLPL